MKILYVARLFSGLANSVAQQKWQPAGVPTIYKMVEALDAKHEALFMLLPKGGFKQHRCGVINLPPLRSAFHILPSEHLAPCWLGRHIGYALREIVQFYYVLRTLRRFRPDILYIDHGNTLLAALVAHCYRDVRVVFRLMGCYGLKTSFTGSNPLLCLFRWGYRAPFAAVICTQEGSNVDYWVNRALDETVPLHVLLNGVDAPKEVAIDPRLTALPQDKTIVLSIGRLDPDKSAREFLAAFLLAWRRDPEHFHALIIGGGKLKTAILAEIQQSGAEQAVTFIENLAHEQIACAHRLCHIYVSLNRAGNLSNANLEAMQAGQCMIIPKSQAETGIDLILDELLSEEAVLRVSSDNIEEIAEAINKLHTHPELRSAMSAQLQVESAKFLCSWEARIQKEMMILESLVDK